MDKANDCTMLERDILEWDIPEEVLVVLLKDRTTGKNILWGTDDYSERGEGFEATSVICVEQVADRENKIIRPRVDKRADEQRGRVVKRAEVFTPSWICNRQNNLVDAAWFGWKKPDSSPFNTEERGFNSENELGWNSTCGRRCIAFPKGKTWQDYVMAPRLEVSCGEAPYLTSRYDTVSGRIIPVDDRIGFLDRKLRVVTENVGIDDVQRWLYFAKRAVQSVYGFDWQGDNVLLARENILAAVIESFNADFFNESSSSLGHFIKAAPPSLPGLPCLLEFAEIISWNVWQMDGIKFVVPMSCTQEEKETPLLDGTTEIRKVDCPGCRLKDRSQHNGKYCKVMNWQTGSEIKFLSLLEGGHGNWNSANI